MRNFSLLIKPASFGCNLRCEYCFYLKKNQLYNGASHHMTDPVLERLVSSYMALDMPSYAFAWQGGEPTTMGLDFFKRVIALQQKYGQGGKSVSNALQTNGTLLDDEWAEHLARYHFLTGISLDGPAELHDRYRLTVDGRGSHAQVLRGIEALRRHHAEFNILTLVNRYNSRKPLEIYHYLKELGVFYHQYIECVEFDSSGNLAPYAVEPEAWADFLCAIFDEWYANDTRTVSVRLFDAILTKMVEGFANVCSMGRDCRQYLVVEHNGDIYPCDFFVRPELKLGNLMNGDWGEFLQHPLYAMFGARKANWNERCQTCEYLAFCAGDCQKNRVGGGDTPRKLSVLCEAWQRFYHYTLPRFETLAAEIRRDRLAASLPPPPTGASARVSRNDPCPCGSGRKYKRCCGR
jgi:uncharacterized protein